MKYIVKCMRFGLLLAVSAMFFLASCNKAPEILAGPGAITPPAGNTLGATIAAIPTDSLYYKIIVKSGLLTTLNTSANTFTLFVPDNNAVRAFITAITGGAVPSAAPDAVFAAFINSASFPAASAGGIVAYNMCPQALTTSSIPGAFPNFYYPTNLNPAPSLSALLRLDTYPSTRNGNWVNNIPLTAVNTAATNGIIHTSAAVAVPPSRFLWDRINADPDMTYLKSAIQRADSGVSTSSTSSLQWALSNIGPNLTVYAPTNAAFSGILTALITQGLIAQGLPPAVAAAQAALLISTYGPNIFSVPALYGSITAQTVKGIIVYHLMGYRAFTNNFPTTATSYPTALNSAIPTHPGVSIKCVFTGLLVTSATVKGVVNASASNIVINPTPDPGGTSDQHFINGTLHKIDQVLLPQ